MAKPDLRSMLMLHGTLLVYAVVSVFAKLAGTASGVATALVFLALEVLALGVYSVLWQQVLKRMELNFAYSNKGICTLWTALAGLLFFGEQLTLGKAAGICVVLIGVLLVVTDHE